MSETEYIAQEITVTKQFLMRTYIHPLLAPMPGTTINDEFYLSMWKNQAEIQQHKFGGLYGQQFTNVEQLTSFNEALFLLFAKHKVNLIHKDELLYLVRFYRSDTEEQSISKNRYNRLIEYTRLILDISRNSEKHIQAYLKNKAYKQVLDTDCQEYFFARQTLFDKYSLQEIIECRPNDNPGDIVTYMRFNIGCTELYVPSDMRFNLQANHELKNFNGEPVKQFDIPLYLQSEVFRYTFEYMIDEHRRANTPFYNLISKAPLTNDDYKKLYNQYKKNRFSETDALVKFGMIITGYLQSNGIIKVQRKIAAFLFEYYSILKIFPLKRKLNIPDNYAELSNFYNRQGYTSETIRLMMKDAQKLGKF
ncbi:hypothetical protein INP83_03080 [Mucilaginibacter sp. 21P]|uniref:hypothetical protein n=1 Tax=Mucilaginibacter sp. 21P TaxID=2778902 RepID=UPI001C567D92|nr:hypothetical protein [Mucilaginibacter sp. 21P]QXV66093.1 hypothetical protein INP83_03080 [Mucilaginibacter sp. 21P]